MINSIPDLMIKNYKRFKTKDILFDKHVSINYEDLFQESFKFSNYLKKKGFKKKDRIGIFMTKNINQSIAIIGCLMGNYIFVPILPKLNHASINHIIKNCSMRAIITDEIKINEIKFFEKKIKIIQYKKIRDYINKLKIKINKKKKFNIKKQDPASIIYSSGSTGRPKGITIPHINFVKGAKIVSKYLNTKENDKIAGVLSLNFDYGLNQLWQTLMLGCTLYFYEFIFANDFFKFLKKKDITVLPLMPVMIYLMFKEKRDIQNYNFSRIRYICTSGGPVSKLMINNLTKNFKNTKIYLMYGLTEAFRSSYLNPKFLKKKYKSIGQAIPTVKLDILNDEMKPCKPGEIGELVHRGGCVSLGYWNDKKNTNKVFKKFKGEIAVFSGDLVKKDKEGDIFFIGRKDHMIKTAGYRVSPSEVEYELLKNKSINNLFVFGVKDNNLGQSIICAYTAKKKISDKVFHHLSQKYLPSYMRPKKFHYFRKFPVTGNQGKIDKNRVINELKK